MLAPHLIDSNDSGSNGTDIVRCLYYAGAVTAWVTLQQRDTAERS